MKTAVVICPGRGSYTKAEMGYLARHFAQPDLLARFDAQRSLLGQETLTALDAAPAYSVARHTRGDNASALIYAGSLGDFRSLRGVEVVAVTGNSMGWYSALGASGALRAEDGFTVANTMGTLMQEHLIGGQTLYPFVGDDWRPEPEHKAALLTLVAAINAGAGQVLALSIDLGGMLVLAGNAAGLEAFEASVPASGRFPMRLANHAAFHTALQLPVAALARARLPASLFRQPDLPLIDGRGHVWWPGAVDTQSLWDYTLGHQVIAPYDFTRAITVAAREFAPDLFILAGPGNSLGGAVAQSLIAADWQGMASKADFQARQATDPVLISMGMAEQRALVT